MNYLITQQKMKKKHPCTIILKVNNNLHKSQYDANQQMSFRKKKEKKGISIKQQT